LLDTSFLAVWIAMNPFRIALLLALCLCCSACGEPDYQEVPIHPAAGKITVGGKPAFGAVVVFHPQGDVGMSKGNKPFAAVAEDGSFQATTYVTGDGAPAGDYVVTVIWPQDPHARGPSPDRLRGRYATPEKSDLKVTIGEGENNLPTWEL
jgi:hypothetical protein